MAYKKQNFEDGQLLTAEELNHIEDGIVENEKNVSKAVRYDYQNLSEAQKTQARTNIGAVGQGDLEDATNVALEKAKASGEFNGKDGENGKTPYIHNGYWFIDEVNTGVKAQGIDGYTPRKGVDYFDGKDGANGKDGKDGVDGYTPQKGIDYFDGQPGKDGADGKTPVKGTDYFTEDEVQEIAERAAGMVDAPEGGGTCEGAVLSVNGITPDENGNVEIYTVTSWNDLTDKPFYDETPEPITWDGNTEGLEADPVSGSMYKILDKGLSKDEFIGATFRGYSPGSGNEVCPIVGDDMILDLGELDPSIPLGTFFLDSAGTYFLSIVDEVNFNGVPLKKGFYVSEHFISLTFPEKVKPLDEKFLPDSVVLESELDAKGYQTEAQVTALINEALGVIENGTY
jgi:hypothetical protein